MTNSLLMVVAPPVGQSFHCSSKICQQLKELAQVQTFMVPRG